MKKILTSIVTVGAILLGVSADLSRVPGVTGSVDLDLFIEAKDMYL
jgi:hypothetical protein